jgi:hypothetical protein
LDNIPKFLKDSECRAHKKELACEEGLLKKCKKADRPEINDVIDDTKEQIKKWCD